MTRRLPNCAYSGMSLKRTGWSLCEFPGIAGKPQIGWHVCEPVDCVGKDPIHRLLSATNEETLIMQLRQIESRGEGRLVAIDEKARLPRVDYPPLRIGRFSGAALTDGVEQHAIEGVSIRVYSPAKTVADCFKYRNKIGLDIALEALRDCLRRWRNESTA